MEKTDGREKREERGIEQERRGVKLDHPEQQGDPRKTKGPVNKEEQFMNSPVLSLFLNSSSSSYIYVNADNMLCKRDKLDVMITRGHEYL